MRHLFAVAAGAAILLAGATTPAAAAGHWKFDLHNNSAAKVLTFKTQEDGEWSENWLPENVDPGETYEMDFGTDEGDCEVRTRISFSDGTYVDANIDYCHASNIYVRNDDVKWD
jgi:hypothetical protein